MAAHNNLAIFVTVLICLQPVEVISSPLEHDSILIQSSKTNARLAGINYPNEPFQRWVVMVWGDEIPKMRDDLIRRKSAGQGFFIRHLAAWKTPHNWEINENHKRDRSKDPFEFVSSKSSIGTLCPYVGIVKFLFTRTSGNLPTCQNNALSF